MNKTFRYKVVLKENNSNQYEFECELSEEAKDELIAKRALHHLKNRLQDRLLPDAHKRSRTPSLDSLSAYGFSIESIEPLD